MTKKAIVLAVILFTGLTGFNFKNILPLNEFNYYFDSGSLRIDYYLIGTAENEQFVLQQLKHEPHWGGPNKVNQEAELDLGNYRFILFDSITDKPIFRKGFCSLFQEWQTTAEAKSKTASYYHVNMMPFPKRTVKYVLEKRSPKDGLFYKLYEQYINPKNYFIINEKPHPFKIDLVQGNNKPKKRVDIAFIAEGYTKEEMGKYRSDVKKTWNYITSIAPFSDYKELFNVYAIESPSVESGTDIPGEFIYKNTLLNSSFYTFDTPRYLTTTDIKTLHDVAAAVPYDHLFVLINSDRYGGGGFYNYYSCTTSDHGYSLKVAIHEFGHGFAGLGDEYYTSDVSYEEMYNLAVEPWEPNITTLVDFDKKWKDMVHPKMEILTPRNYDLRDSVGVFEGGGYVAKGICSPFQDCRMKSNIPDSFCPVCTRAIERVINYYTEY